MGDLLRRVSHIENATRSAGGTNNLDMDEDPIESPLDTIEELEEMESKLEGDKAFRAKLVC